MAVAQLLRIQKSIIVTLQLLLLLLPLPLLLQASPCPIVEKIMNVTTASEADALAEALLCAGSGQFAVTWHGDVILSRTISVSNGSTLNVKGSSENTDVDTGAVVIGDGTDLMFKVDHGSNVSLTGLTFSGGNGTLSVTGDSSIEVINCTFVGNNKTSSSEESSEGGAIYIGDGSYASFGGEIIFANNTADGYGGAVYVGDGSYASFSGETVFANNAAESLGGAVYVGEGSYASFGGKTVFANNTAKSLGGAIYSRDGSEINITEEGRVSFFNNNAGSNGGAIRLFNQSYFNSYGTASFVYNMAGHEGESITTTAADGSELNFIGNISFKGDHAFDDGGVFALYGGSEAIFIGNVLFEGNHAFINGGAAVVKLESIVSFGGETFFANNTAEQNGGAILLFNQSIFNSYGIASFESNEAQFGGAISAEDSELNFNGNVSFEGNSANVSGGSVYVMDDSNALFTGEAVFALNTAYYGGAAFIYGGSNVSFGGDTSFANNTAEGYGGAIDSRGDSEVIVTEEGRVSFGNNHAVGSGGAIRLNDRSVFKSFGTASFVSNGAQFGGAFSLDNSEGNFIGKVSFEGNHANTSGGAIALYDGSIIHVDGMASFVGNEATHNGGAFYASGSSVFVGSGTLFMFNKASTGSGGGVYASSSVMSLNEAIFTKNHGVWGGGVAFFSCGSILDKEIGGVASFSSGSMLDKENGGVASFSSLESDYISYYSFYTTASSTNGENNVSSSSISGGENDEYGPSNITGCSFDGNTAATDGGAIYTAAGYDMVVNSSFMKNFAAAQGGALLHSGVLVALTGSTFESNMAGEDGLAVMSLGMAEKIADLLFRNNSLFCASGKYSLMKDINETEDSDTCRWGLVCSRCTDQCKAPENIDMDEATVPVCEVVPEGVSTTANPGMTLETLNLMPGFYRTSNQSREVLECFRKEACIGGSNVDRYCAEGYAGPYCATCDEGYGSGFQYSCHSCQRTDKWAGIGGAGAVLVVTMIVVALGVAYLVGVVDRPISELSGKCKRRVLNLRDGLVRAFPLPAIKIVLVSWQIITQFSGVTNVQYPPAYETFLAALSVVNLNLGSILSLSCVVETSFYARLVVVTMTPMAMLGALAITYLVAMVRNGHSTHAMRVARNKHLSAGLFLVVIVYSSVSYTIFQTFVCDSLDSGVTYLRADYDLVCWTNIHVAYMTYAGIMILVYPVGIPAVFAWVLFINRDGIKSVAETSNGSRVPPESEAIKDLWAPYKPSRYYYEVIECGRRIALTGLAVFIYPGSTAQVAIEVLLAVVFFSISEILSPFAEPLDAWLYRSGTWVIFLSMFLALLLKVDATDEDSDSQNVFAGLLIAAHGGMVLVMIANALLSALKGFKEVRAIEIEMPSKKFGSASTRANDIGILEEDEDNESKYNSNPIL